ncbi:MAG: class I SAM-dependent methyltransferase [Fidelibacterota bacterium]|nr:MAG: class I SAM-dependent methyltransferase [Candidatus Neomarinimicrobiota bacterium]
MFLLCLSLFLPLSVNASRPTPAITPHGFPADTVQVYTYGEPSSGGTGKLYMGREIAAVMKPSGAAWLDRPAREREEQPELLITNLPLRPTDVVADIGAGTGYFTFRISPLLTQGRCLAVDVQPEMVTAIEQRMQEQGVRNVVPILGSMLNPNLPPAAVDLVLMVDAYHEFSHPREMMTAIVQALKPGALVVLVEYRGEDAKVRRHPLHKMTQIQAQLEMAAVGLHLRESRDILPQQHVLVFEKVVDPE